MIDAGSDVEVVRGFHKGIVGKVKWIYKPVLAPEDLATVQPITGEPTFSVELSHLEEVKGENQTSE
jgi:hypothetical protein